MSDHEVKPLPDDIAPEPSHHTMQADTGVFTDPAADASNATTSAGPITANIDDQPAHPLTPSALQLEPEVTPLGDALMLEIRRVRDVVLPSLEQAGRLVSCHLIGADVDKAELSMREANSVAMQSSLHALKSYKAA